jgi:DNA repair photolyase
MHSEQDWVTQEDASNQAYKYYMRNDPTTREFMGPIETEYDDYLKQEVRFRHSKVGTVRGATKENMRDVKVYLDPIPHLRVTGPKPLQGWYSNKNDGSLQNQRDRPCMTDAVLTQPYGGYCSVGCTSFCYVMSGQYGYRATGLTSVPLNYGEYVRKQLTAMQTGQAGYFSSFTDPFMKIEELYHNTQQGATAFVEAGLPVFFLSRLKYPGWAFDLLQKNKFSYMQKSINTPNQADWKLLSPGATSLAEHFEQIREARRKGIYVSIQCNPLIPGVVDHSDIEHLIELLAEAGTNHIIFKFVESNHAWRDSMVLRLTEKFGSNRMAIFAQLMSEKQGGNQTTIEEGYRREGHERYRAKCQSLGLTSSLCYEYTRRREGGANQASGLFGEVTHSGGKGKWVSMGSEFLTSDQCHGQRVPFHVKHADGKFHPLGVCPPSGCLSCADKNEGKARCGSELLGSAKALVLADFKKDPGIDASALKIERYRPK